MEQSEEAFTEAASQQEAPAAPPLTWGVDFLRDSFSGSGAFIAPEAAAARARTNARSRVTDIFFFFPFHESEASEVLHLFQRVIASRNVTGGEVTRTNGPK